MQEALDEAIQFYKNNGIDVITPITIRKSEMQMKPIMRITTNKINIYNYNEEILDTEFSHMIIAGFLNIHIPRAVLRESIEEKVNKIRKAKQNTISAVIEYDDGLAEMLKKENNPSKKIVEMMIHEVWHDIEDENEVSSNIICEGTATYAMLAYNGTTTTLDNILNRTQLRTSEELTYKYSAALVKKYMNGSTDLKKMLDKEFRQHVSREFKKKMKYFSRGILQNEMQNDPSGFIEYLNALFEIFHVDNPKAEDLNNSDIFNSLNRKDKEYISGLYESLNKRIVYRKEASNSIL